MTYENFLKVILGQQVLDKKIEEAYNLNIDLINFVDGYHEIITVLIKEIYGEDGYEWYSWFCHESDYGHKGIEAWDKDKNPICYSFESLYEYLEANCKTRLVKRVVEEVKEGKIVEPLNLQDLLELMIADAVQIPYKHFKKIKDKVVKEDEYISIYEHQRTAAGRELGKKVATAAQKQGIKPVSREVSTLTYQGPILTYPRSFLDKYFSTK